MEYDLSMKYYYEELCSMSDEKLLGLNGKEVHPRALKKAYYDDFLCQRVFGLVDKSAEQFAKQVLSVVKGKRKKISITLLRDFDKLPDIAKLMIWAHLQSKNHVEDLEFSGKTWRNLLDFVDDLIGPQIMMITRGK